MIECRSHYLVNDVDDSLPIGSICDTLTSFLTHAILLISSYVNFISGACAPLPGKLFKGLVKSGLESTYVTTIDLGVASTSIIRIYMVPPFKVVVAFIMYVHDSLP